MADDPEVFAGELEKIYEAGRNLMPGVAKAYANASRDMHNVSWNEDDAFGRTGASMSYTMGPAFPEWRRLRDFLQVVLYKTSDALVDTGAALVEIANAYAAQDEQSGALFAPIRAGLDGKVVATVPIAKRPGDEHDVMEIPDWDVEVPRR